MSRVAALYVETGGVYYGLPDVDPWDEQRDARLYDGPWPVVAHPPCARWCQIAALVEQRYGYMRGDDGGTFEAALKAVERFGGVLEHPAWSGAWKRYGLPRPNRWGWTASLDRPGWATEVDQHLYGHRARKTTWLYAVGIDPMPLNYTHAPKDLPLVSAFSYNRGAKWHTERMRVRPIEASRTPPAFRDVLLDLARSASPARERVS